MQNHEATNSFPEGPGDPQEKTNMVWVQIQKQGDEAI